MTSEGETMTSEQIASQWIARSTSRDRLLVWQNAEPYDHDLPSDRYAREIIRTTVARSFRARSRASRR